MRATVRAGRSRLLFALLLVLLGVSGAVAPAAATGYAEPSSITGATVATAPSVQNELRDWLRLSGAARHAQATAMPDTWSAVCPHTPGACELRGRPYVSESSAAGMAARTATSRSSRAPPLA